MPGHNMLYVGRHRHMTSLGYVSPYLLEILNSSVGFSSQVATGTLTANTGQTVTCSRAASAYCLGNDGLLHLLGPNTARVEPSGLLLEGASTNFMLSSVAIGDANYLRLSGGPTTTLNSTDVTDPAGGHEASKLDYSAGGSPRAVYQNTGNTSGLNSVYLRCLTGTATVGIGDNATVITTCNVTTTWQRFTVAGGNGNFCIGSIGLGPTTTDIIYAWGAQSESIALPTSLIRTTSAAASRDADVVTVATNPLPSAPAAFSIGGTYRPLTTWQDSNAANSGQSGVWGWGANASAKNCTTYVDSRIVTVATDDSGTGTWGYVCALPGWPTPTIPTKLGASWTTLPSATGLPVGGSNYTTTGTNVQTPPASPVYLGSADAIWPFFGHITDFIVNNSVVYP